jgi:hypothetical protein
MEVFVCRIGVPTDENGGSVSEITLWDTPLAALSQVVRYCTEHWDSQDPIPDDPEAMVKQFYEDHPNHYYRLTASQVGTMDAVSSMVPMTPDEAMTLLLVKPDYDAGDGPGPHVHTFRVSKDMPSALRGAHWSVDDLRAEMTQHGVEETTDAALIKVGHNLVINRRPGDSLFLETKPKEK